MNAEPYITSKPVFHLDTGPNVNVTRTFEIRIVDCAIFSNTRTVTELKSGMVWATHPREFIVNASRLTPTVTGNARIIRPVLDRAVER